MNHNDERDHAEEADNKAAMVAEGTAELTHGHMRACALRTDLRAACTCEALVYEMAKAQIESDRTHEALVRWVNDNYSSVLTALERMADRNEADAVELADEPATARVLCESAESWRRMAGELRTLQTAVWDTTPPAGNDVDPESTS